MRLCSTSARAPEGDAVAAAAVEPQQRIELIAEILDQERISARPRNPEVEIPIGGAQCVVNARLKSGDLRLMAANALGERRDILRTHVPRGLPGGKALKDLAARRRSIAASRASPRRPGGPGSGRG